MTRDGRRAQTSRPPARRAAVGARGSRTLLLRALGRLRLPGRGARHAARRARKPSTPSSSTTSVIVSGYFVALMLGLGFVRAVVGRGPQVPGDEGTRAHRERPAPPPVRALPVAVVLVPRPHGCGPAHGARVDRRHRARDRAQPTAVGDPVDGDVRAAASIVLAFIQPLLAAAVAIVVGAGIAYGLWRARALYPTSLALQEALGEWSEFVEQQVQGIRVVKGHGFEPQFARTRRGAMPRASRSRASRSRRPAPPSTRPCSPGPGSAMLVVVGLGGWLGATGRMTPGDLLAFLQYVALLITPVIAGAELLSNWPQASASSARIAEVLAAEPDVTERPHAAPPAGRAGHDPLRRRELRLRARPSAVRRPRPRRRRRIVGRARRRERRRARRRSRSWRAASTTRRPGACSSTGHRSTNCGSTSSEARCRSCSRTPSCSRRASATTCASGGPKRPTREIERGREPRRGRHVRARVAERVRHRRRSAGLLAVGRPTATPRDRPGDPARLPGADPRRCDERGRPADRSRHPAWPRRGDARPHHARDRAPGRDDQPGRSRRPARRWPRRRRRNARRTARNSPSTGARSRSIRSGRHDGATTPEPPLRVVLREFRPFRRDGYEALAGIAIAVVAQVSSPLVVAYAINHGVTERDTSVIAACTAVMAVLVVAQVSGSYFEQRAMGRFARAVSRRPPPSPARPPAHARPRLLLPRAGGTGRRAADVGRREPPAVPAERSVAPRPWRAPRDARMRRDVHAVVAAHPGRARGPARARGGEPLVPAARVRSATRLPRVDGEPPQPRERGPRRHARRAGLRHRTATARHVRRHQRRRVRRAHPERSHHVALLRRHRVPAPGRADDRHRVRRGARRSRQDRGRHAHRVHALPHAPLRTDPAVHRAEHADAGRERRVHADVRVPRARAVARRLARCCARSGGSAAKFGSST